MKTTFTIAATAAVLALACAGSASAQTTYAFGTFASGAPTLSGGDDAYVNAIDTTAPGVTFYDSYLFRLASVGPTTDVYASINNVAFSTVSNQPSVTNLVASFYELAGDPVPVGTITGGNGSIALASNETYAVTVTGQTTTKYGGSYQFDVQTSPVPGPTGFLVAIAGMGALFLQRRRISGALSA